MERKISISMELDPKIAKAFAHSFIPRQDIYAIQNDDGSYATIKKPLTDDFIIRHIAGEITLGAYALDADSRASWICVDPDEREEFVALSYMAHKLQGVGVHSYLERSRRGGHLWLFFEKQPGADARRLGKQLIADYGLPEDIELFPKQDELKTGPGSLVRLPLGIHKKTGRRYHFITPQGEPMLRFRMGRDCCENCAVAGSCIHLMPKTILPTSLCEMLNSFILYKM